MAQFLKAFISDSSKYHLLAITGFSKSSRTVFTLKSKFKTFNSSNRVFLLIDETSKKPLPIGNLGSLMVSEKTSVNVI